MADLVLASPPQAKRHLKHPDWIKHKRQHRAWVKLTCQDLQESWWGGTRLHAATRLRRSDSLDVCTYESGVLQK